MLIAVFVVFVCYMTPQQIIKVFVFSNNQYVDSRVSGVCVLYDSTTNH